MKINIYRGDLIHVSAINISLLVLLHIEVVAILPDIHPGSLFYNEMVWTKKDHTVGPLIIEFR